MSWGFSLLLGATGLAKKFVELVPDALKAGILLGAGIAAVRLVFEKEGHFDTYPWDHHHRNRFVFLSFVFHLFKSLRTKNKALSYLADLGLLPALLLAIVIAPIFKELPWPNIEWGFTVPNFTTLFKEWTPFSSRIGFPAFSLYMTAFPLVVATYIVLFGELIQAEALVDEAREFRHGDEDVHFDPNRNNIIVGMRNVTMSMIAPDLSMCGPMWACDAGGGVRTVQESAGRQWTIFSAQSALFCLGDLHRLLPRAHSHAGKTDPAHSALPDHADPGLCCRKGWDSKSQDVQRSGGGRSGRRGARLPWSGLCVRCRDRPLRPYLWQGFLPQMEHIR